MLEGGGIVNNTVKEPSWQSIVEWLMDGCMSIPVQTVRNAWKDFECLRNAVDQLIICPQGNENMNSTH